MSGGAPAFDSSGKMFLTTANGTFDDSSDTIPAVVPNNDFSQSFLNLSPATLMVQDYFTPTGEAAWSSRDFDVGSAGVTVLPDGAGPTAHPNLVVSADKQSHLWLVDRTDMGRFSTIMDPSVQSLTLPLASQCPGNCVFDSPGYYNGTVYIAPSSCPLMALPLTSGLFPTTAQSIAIPSSLSADIYNYPGPTPSITASPSGNAIVWVLDNSLFAFHDPAGTNPASGPAVLRAYAATNVTTALYSSSTLTADTGGNAVKFTVPVVANGHVYVGGSKQVSVYGLAP